MIVAAVALILIALFVVNLCEAAKRGDEVNEDRLREIHAHDRRAQMHLVELDEIDFEWSAS